MLHVLVRRAELFRQEYYAMRREVQLKYHRNPKSRSGKKQPKWTVSTQNQATNALENTVSLSRIRTLAVPFSLPWNVSIFFT